ncbi:MAG: short-chain dehydrogenase [Chitinophagaceae bacterium]|nr:short-chain dehydrogenase [Chitinophagaceae bacterium]
MDIERIESFIKSSIRNNTTIDIHFKGRPPVTGLFIHTNDYEELKSKNFWRVVHISQIQNWSATNDINVARIFNGASFTSLTNTKSN